MTNSRGQKFDTSKNNGSLQCKYTRDLYKTELGAPKVPKQKKTSGGKK